MKSITPERLAGFTERDYELTFGITEQEFVRMLAALETAYAKEHRRRPRFVKLTM